MQVHQAFRNAVPKRLQVPSKKQKRISEETNTALEQDEAQEHSKTKAENPTIPTVALEDMPSPDPYFYLHCPDATGPQPQVIHLEGDAILAHGLQRRLVLEFPTIFVLHDPPQLLPDRFHLVESDTVQTASQADEVQTQAETRLKDQSTYLTGEEILEPRDDDILKALEKDLST